jgi:two-component system, OmpR family, phosphate regulon sensor histidine kinase PhoR
MTAGTNALAKLLSHITPLKKLAAILILLVIFPAIFYSAYEINSLTQSEALVERIYRQQLDAILFSLNQYAWDIANSWASDINRIDQAQQRSSTPRGEDEFRTFLSANKGIQALFIADTSAANILSAASSPADSAHVHFPASDYLALLRSNSQAIFRLMRLQETGYRKIEGVLIGTVRENQSTCLLFITGSVQNRMHVAGIVLDAESFVRDVLRHKLEEAAGGEFNLSVIRTSDNRPIYSTGSFGREGERQTKDLWLFPHYSLGIRLRGQTIEDLVAERFYRNLSLLALLDIMIIAGVWFVYRTIRREMELTQLKTDFVSNVSHELRTPLSLIRMFGETLEMGRVTSEEQRQEYYSTIVRESERLTGLVNNVLNFSRMESGRKEYHLESVDLNEIVINVTSRYAPQIEQLGFRIDTQMGDSLPLLQADRQAVSEAVLNILDNAVKYSGSARSIRVATGIAGPCLFVEVEDHGIGIAPQEQSQIFDKFFRSSSESVRQTKGSGLGLTLVQHIMKAHKGEVTLKSRVGEGSIFRLSFPLT